MKYHITLEVELEGNGDAYSAAQLIHGALHNTHRLIASDQCHITSIQQGMPVFARDDFNNKLLEIVKSIMPKREGWQEGDGNDKA